MNDDQDTVFFLNNCNGFDHVAQYGSGAFFDLGTGGRQGNQATNLRAGQDCVVASYAHDGRIELRWYSFSHEGVLPGSDGTPSRVFFGKLVASETYPKEKAAHSARYRAFFRQNGKYEGGFKIGSVFHGVVPQDDRPVSTERTKAVDPKDNNHMDSGAGFGNPIENKLVETAAINAVKKRYENGGWSVRSVERDKCGFDLECRRKGVVENVEVKGVRATEQCFIITAGEVEQAKKNSNFVLMVVTSALSASPILTRYSGAEFSRRFNLSPIQYRATLRS